MNNLSIRCGECHTPRKDVSVGVDVVAVSAIAASIEAFGERFLRRIFSPHELATASGSLQRLAARFAVKEAAIKAFDMAEVGVDWRHIELHSDAAGRPSLRLGGRALAHVNTLGLLDISVSLSHEQDIAFATVVALRAQRAHAGTG